MKSMAMKDSDLAEILAECLEAMKRGESDLNSLARRYPEASKQILPLLKLAAQLRERAITMQNH